jgi:signal transduction histidine kinase
LADLYHANDCAVIAAGRALDFEEPSAEGDDVRVYAASKFPLRTAGGAPYAVCSISTDITDRKRADDDIKMARLEAERANRAKSDFLSRMSHDLRTPLNAILGFAQLLQLDATEDDRRDSVRQILKGGAHLLELINEVLDIARIEAGHLALSLEPVSVGDVVQQALDLVRPLASARGITLDGPRISGSAHVLADHQRLTQILLNLLSNAVKYNRPRGRVELSYHSCAGGRLRITVTDTGAGIREEELATLFTPFERLGADQTATEGTGLGLALSKGLAEAMGGTLGVVSAINQGTTFWVELAECPTPDDGAQAPDVVSAGSSNVQEGSGIVLYIEDNASNVRLLERVLQRRPGITLLVANTGRAGLAIAHARRPDLIFLDLHLSDCTEKPSCEGCLRTRTRRPFLWRC